MSTCFSIKGKIQKKITHTPGSDLEYFEEHEYKKTSVKEFIKNTNIKLIKGNKMGTIHETNKAIIEHSKVGAEMKFGELKLNLLTVLVFDKIQPPKILWFKAWKPEKVKPWLDPIIRILFVYTLNFIAQYSKRNDVKYLAKCVTMANGGKTIDNILDPIMRFFK